MRTVARWIVAVGTSLASAVPRLALADDAADRFPEPVVTHTVERGETCEDVAHRVYGAPKHGNLVLRYNHVSCAKGSPLDVGVVLTLPAGLTDAPAARLRVERGGIDVSPAGGSTSREGAAVARGSRVRSDNGAAGMLVFTDGTRLELHEGSTAEVLGVADPSGAVLELASGEVAILRSADRGATDSRVPIVIRVTGGGRIEASSQAATIAHDEKGTTVSVFEGSAVVESGGKRVVVPAGSSSHFDDKAAPLPPHVVLEAPHWSGTTTSHVELVSEGTGSVRGAWEDSVEAGSYRIELSRDAAFRDVIARQDLDHTNDKTFHFDHLLPGIYFAHVMGRDAQGAVGLPSPPIQIGLVEVGFARGGGQLGATITASPYAALRFSPAPGIEMAVGNGAFGEIPANLELSRGRPSSLSFRVSGAGGALTQVRLDYSRASAEISLNRSRSTDEGKLIVTLHGLEGIDVDKAVAPRARIHRGEVAERVALDPVTPSEGDPKYTTMIPHPGEVTLVEILDADGNVIGSAETSGSGGSGPPAEAPPPKDDKSKAGVMAPSQTLGAYGPPLWWSPSAPTAASIGGMIESDFHGGPTDGGGRLLTMTSLGPLGVEIALKSDAFRHVRAADPGGWGGLRLRFLGGKTGAIEAGAAVRVGFPITKYSNPARLEGGFGMGQEIGRWSWLVDVGTRFQLQDGVFGAFAMPGEVVGGGTYQIISWMRAEAMLDAEVAMDALKPNPCVLCQDTGAHPSGGLSVGVEAGKEIFGALTARISPFAAAYGNISAQASLGARTSP